MLNKVAEWTTAILRASIVARYGAAASPKDALQDAQFLIKALELMALAIANEDERVDHERILNRLLVEHANTFLHLANNSE